MSSCLAYKDDDYIDMRLMMRGSRASLKDIQRELEEANNARRKKILTITGSDYQTAGCASISALIETPHLICTASRVQSESNKDYELSPAQLYAQLDMIVAAGVDNVVQQVDHIREQVANINRAPSPELGTDNSNAFIESMKAMMLDAANVNETIQAEMEQAFDAENQNESKSDLDPDLNVTDEIVSEVLDSDTAESNDLGSGEASKESDELAKNVDADVEIKNEDVELSEGALELNNNDNAIDAIDEASIDGDNLEAETKEAGLLEASENSEGIQNKIEGNIDSELDAIDETVSEDIALEDGKTTDSHENEASEDDVLAAKETVLENDELAETLKNDDLSQGTEASEDAILATDEVSLEDNIDIRTSEAEVAEKLEVSEGVNNEDLSQSEGENTSLDTNETSLETKDVETVEAPEMPGNVESLSEVESDSNTKLDSVDRNVSENITPEDGEPTNGLVTENPSQDIEVTENTELSDAENIKLESSETTEILEANDIPHDVTTLDSNEVSSLESDGIEATKFDTVDNSLISEDAPVHGDIDQSIDDIALTENNEFDDVISTNNSDNNQSLDRRDSDAQSLDQPNEMARELDIQVETGNENKLSIEIPAQETPLSDGGETPTTDAKESLELSEGVTIDSPSVESGTLEISSENLTIDGNHPDVIATETNDKVSIEENAYSDVDTAINESARQEAILELTDNNLNIKAEQVQIDTPSTDNSTGEIDQETTKTSEFRGEDTIDNTTEIKSDPDISTVTENIIETEVGNTPLPQDHSETVTIQSDPSHGEETIDPKGSTLSEGTAPKTVNNVDTSFPTEKIETVTLDVPSAERTEAPSNQNVPDADVIQSTVTDNADFAAEAPNSDASETPPVETSGAEDSATYNTPEIETNSTPIISETPATPTLPSDISVSTDNDRVSILTENPTNDDKIPVSENVAKQETIELSNSMTEMSPTPEGLAVNKTAPEVVTSDGDAPINTGSQIETPAVSDTGREEQVNQIGSTPVEEASLPVSNEPAQPEPSPTQTETTLGYQQPQTAEPEPMQHPEVQKGESLVQAPVVQETQIQDNNQQHSHSHEHGAGCQCSACNPFNKASGAEEVKFKSDIKLDVNETPVQFNSENENNGLSQQSHSTFEQHAPNVQKGESLVQASVVQETQIQDNNQQQPHSHEHGAGCQCSACNPFNKASEKPAEFKPETKIDLGFDVTKPKAPEPQQQTFQPTVEEDNTSAFVATNKDDWQLGDFIKEAQNNNSLQDKPKGGPCSDCFSKACSSCSVAGNPTNASVEKPKPRGKSLV